MKMLKWDMSKKQGMSPKQVRFISNVARGMSKKDSAISAGYSPLSASTIASNLMKKSKIVQALDKIGVTDKAIARGIKTNIEAGMGIKATASDSLRGLELASRLKGHLNKENEPSSLSQTNIYINELKQMDDDQLADRLKELTEEIKAYNH